jgi:hypothetical protein
MFSEYRNSVIYRFHIPIIPLFYKIVKKNVDYLQKTLDNVNYLKYNVNRLQTRRLKPMKMTEQEKGLLGLFRKVESCKNREDVLFHAQAILRAEEALREEYGLVGPDAPLFNGLAEPGPVYADRNPAPVGAALAEEVQV